MSDISITTQQRNINVTVSDTVIQVEVIGGPGPVGADGARYIGHSTEYFASMPVNALQTFQVETGLAFTPTQWVIIYPEPASSSNYSFGFVDSYNAVTGVLVIYIEFNDGNPAASSWIINLSGPQGPVGYDGNSITGPKGDPGDPGIDEITLAYLKAK